MSRFLASVCAAVIMAVAGTAAAVPPMPQLDLGAGLGCGAQCITQAALTTSTTAVKVAVKTDTPAKITVQVGTEAPMATSQGPMFPAPAATASSPSLTTAFTPTLAGLQPGTTYHVVVRAQDSRGRVAARQGTFKTKALPLPAPPEPLERTATVTLYSIDVIDDGDKVGKGELKFWFDVDGEHFHTTDWYVVKSPGTILLKKGSSHAGTLVYGPTEQSSLDVDVHANECDAAFWDACIYGGEYADASTTIDIAACDGEADALPPNYGTGLPAGGDCYLSFETTQHHVKYRVNGWIDVFYS
jgi:hypothetical protein